MASVKNVLIVGGGIGGLSAAIGLHQQGIQVEIAEIAKISKVYHVGIIVQANFIRALAQIGLGKQAVEAGYAYDGLRMFSPPGDLVAQVPGIPIAGPDFPTDLGLTRPALHKVLLDEIAARGINLRLNTTFTNLDDRGDHVHVTFNDGSEADYDLVIGADGIHSKTRAHLFGDKLKPRFTGQGVWRYNIPRPKEVAWAALVKGIKGGTAGFIPLSEETMYVFLVSAEPDNPFYPQDVQADELRKRLLPYGGQYFPAIREQIVDPELVVYRPLEVLVLDRPWHVGRILLIGDAAHSSTPHLGQGAGMAVEDAVVIAQELAKEGDVGDALRRFHDRRFDRARFVANNSIQLGEWEMNPTPDLDPVGLVRQTLQRVAEPI